MKRTPTYILVILLVGFLAAFFQSCVKKQNFFSSNAASTEQTIVKVLGGGAPGTVFSQNPIDFIATPKQLLAATIRRDPADQASLLTTMTVVVKDDTAAVRAVNASFVNMPSSLYTISVPKTGGIGGTFNLVFQPGEFSKEIYITVPDPTQLNPSSQYGLGFTITSVDGGGLISANNSIVVEVGAKNKYDGKYSLTWTNYHPSSNPGYTGGSTVIEMHTTGGNSCKMWWPDAGAYCMPAILGGSPSYFGIQEPEYTVNPVTNAVTVQNVAVGAVTFYSMATGFNSHYDPATKTFYVKFGYGSGGPYPPFDPATSREWTQTFTYIGPR